jgi:hypothetical protein
MLARDFSRRAGCTRNNDVALTSLACAAQHGFFGYTLAMSIFGITARNSGSRAQAGGVRIAQGEVV